MDRMEQTDRSAVADEEAGKAKQRVLVIAGWGRSGSTILANVLNSAPGVVTLGEINNIWQRGFADDLLCSCGQPFSSCPAWLPIAQAAFGENNSAVAEMAATASAGMGNTWLIKRRIPSLGRRYRNDGDSYGRLLGKLYAAAAMETGAQLLVDASKSPWHCAVAATLDDFDVSVLHLIRDPRGVAYSLRKKVEYQSGDDKIQMDRHSPTESSLAWVYRNRLVESEWRGSDNYLQMRYEDFIANPKGSVQAIMELVGLPDLSAAFVGPNEVDIAPSHNISGNPVRFRKGAVMLRADDQWREQLPSSTQRWVRLITWPHMRHFGYR